jgi:hypothetical protein
MARTPTFKSLREAAEAGYHGKAVNIEGKGLQKVAFADEAYDRRMAERSARVGSPGRSVDEIARTASAAIDRAEGKPATRPQRNPRRTPSTETATSVETRTRMTPEPINRRDPQDASPTTRAPARARRGAQDASPTRSAVTEAPPSIQNLLAKIPGGAARSQADRIADQIRAGRMPLREGLAKINEIFSNLPNLMAGRNEEMRQSRAAAGMARGGMVKKGNTDRRGKGMFYDSKSPRGYK